MGIDFDILEHCKKVRANHGPPYTCPLEKCGRTYKSVCGLQYHLKSFDHDNPTPLPPVTPSTPKNKKGKHLKFVFEMDDNLYLVSFIFGRYLTIRSLLGRRLTKAKIPPTPNVPEPLTFEEAQKMVQFEVNGIACRWNISEPLDVISKEELSDEEIPEVKIEVPQPGRN